ncbi:MAG: hypothetical protein M9904_14575 [Chitinophagaceae bacterium]|nr:hypothetical protein [Chitinophagaceae bacterium]MCO5241272.1 hypothetical protein [Chitinophagaceae bacterium]
MKKIILLLFITSAFYNIADCQITKENWLVGGNAAFSQLQSSSRSAAQSKRTSFQITPLVGYFLWDKFAAGLNPSLTYVSNNVGSTNTIINIGPFIRYYFLNEENIINLFAESGYAYGSITGKGQEKGQHLNTFSFSGGPVIYFNSSVGLEFIIAYNTTKAVGFSGNNSKLQFGIGFQIHLERDK